MTLPPPPPPVLVTTAISYTNGDPHIGHVYESILADFIRRAYTLSGRSCKLLTGTDEHGQKIQETAQRSQITPQELCDQKSRLFQDLNKKAGNQYDYFIRTTQEEHKKQVVESILESHKNGDIYEDDYTGWYNVREESFVTDTEARLTEYRDAVTGTPYERVSEKTNKFRLSRYTPDLSLVHPRPSRVDEPRDISITRTKVSWGIPFPLDTSSTTYVWFDALLNYVTGAKLCFGDVVPEAHHVIGKDILWHHGVIYPAILKSSGLEAYTPKRVIVHGHIVDGSGRKISKSLGNYVDVDEIFSRYSVEALRYFLITETCFSTGDDLLFSHERLVSVHNNELLKSYGNLFQRLFALLRPIQSEINDAARRNDDTAEKALATFLEDLDFGAYKRCYQAFLTEANTILTNEKPWTKELGEKVEILARVYGLFHQASILLYPIIPSKIDELYAYLSGAPFTIEQSFVKIKETGKIIAFQQIK